MFGDRLPEVLRKDSSHEGCLITRIFELREGEMVECAYSLLPSDVEGGPERLGDISLRRNGKEVNLKNIAGISERIPVFISESQENHVSCSKVNGYFRPKHVKIERPDSFGRIAVLLHEFGHVAQSDEFHDPMQHVEICDDFKDIAYKKLDDSHFRLSLLSTAQEFLPRFTGKDVRLRFSQEFLSLREMVRTIDLSILDVKLREVLRDAVDLENKYSDMLHRTGDFDEDAYNAEKAKLKNREEDIFSGIPLGRIRFFLTEPIRISERDATRRALIWMQEIGRELQLSSLVESSDEGAERLFLNLETYGSGCVH